MRRRSFAEGRPVTGYAPGMMGRLSRTGTIETVAKNMRDKAIKAMKRREREAERRAARHDPKVVRLWEGGLAELDFTADGDDAA